MSGPVAGDEIRGTVRRERELDDGWVEREYGDGGKVDTRTPCMPIVLIEAAVRRVWARRKQR